MNKVVVSCLLSLLFCSLYSKKYCTVESNQSYARPTKGFLTIIPYGFCWRGVQDGYFMHHRWAPENIIVNSTGQTIKSPLKDIYAADFLSKDTVALVSKQEPSTIYIADSSSDHVNALEPIKSACAIESLCLFNYGAILNVASIVRSAKQHDTLLLAWYKQLPLNKDDTNKSLPKAWQLVDTINVDQADVAYSLKAPVMYWSHHLQRLFIGMSIKSSEHTTALSSISVGWLNKDSIRMQAFSDKAILKTNDPFYAQGFEKSLYVHHLGEFVARSHHLYLVVVGGQGTALDTAKQVWCAPITANYPQNKRNKKEHVSDDLLGTLAYPLGNAVLNQYMSRGEIKNIYRCYHPSLINKKGVFVDENLLRVGGMSVLPGSINFLYTHEDIIAVSIEDETHGGIFYSRPLYNKEGHVEGWTNWQRLFGIAEPALCFDIDYNTAQVAYITSDDRELTLKKSEWLTDQFPYSAIGIPSCLSNIMNHCALHATRPNYYAQDKYSLLIGAPYAASFIRKDKNNSFEYRYYAPAELQAIGAIECAGVNYFDGKHRSMLGGMQGLCYETIGQNNLAYDTTLQAVRHIAPCANGFVVCAQESHYRYHFEADGLVSKEIFSVPQECGAVLKIVVWHNTFLLCTTKGLYVMHQQDGLYGNWHKIDLYQQYNCAVIDCYAMPTESATINNFYVVTQQGITTALHRVVINHTSEGNLHNASCLAHYQAYSAQALQQPYLSVLQARNMIVTDGIGVWYGVGEYNMPAHKLAYVSQSSKELSWHTSHYGVPMIHNKEYALHAFFYSNLLQTWLGFGDFGILIAH